MNPATSAPMRLLAVVVLYKRTLGEAKSFSSLLEICRTDAEVAKQISIFVQDNSAEAHRPPETAGLNFQYYHAADNPGLPAAYNRALAMANQQHIPWLLLLDQDTALDLSFIRELLSTTSSEAADSACALVPKLVKDGVVLSPHVVSKIFRRFPADFSGFASEPIVAFNSGACLKTEALLKISGFPEAYWLDFLDHIVFHRLRQAGGRFYVLKSKLEHELSFLNLEQEVSIERYRNMLAAEWMFVRETRSKGGPLVHRIRLLRRALLQSLRLRKQSYAWATLRAAAAPNRIGSYSQPKIQS